MSPALFTLTLSDDSRNMANSNDKGDIVCGNRCHGVSQAENRQFTKWHLVCTKEL